MPDPSPIAFTALPFDEAIAYFRDKVPLRSDQFNKLAADARAKAFAVAGTARMDVITDLQAAIDRAISDGTTFATFKKDYKGIMEKRGWEGLSPRRLDTIFRTNIQDAYQTGHYARQMELTTSRPFWQYVAVMDSRVRPAHKAMNGKVMRYDDPFWKTSYPPNGFNCRCTVRSLSQGELTREGLSVERNPGGIADPGFDHMPGEAAGRTLTDTEFARVQSDPGRWTPLMTKTFADYGRPPARDVTAYVPSDTALWPKGTAATELYRQEMLGKVLQDAIGDPLILDEAFITHLTLDGRERFLPLIGDVVSTPYEIWLQAEKEKATGRIVLRKRYIAFIEAEKNNRLIFVIEGLRGQWTSYTFLRSGQAKYPDNVRNGVLLYGE